MNRAFQNEVRAESFGVSQHQTSTQVCSGSSTTLLGVLVLGLVLLFQMASAIACCTNNCVTNVNNIPTTGTPIEDKSGDPVGIMDGVMLLEETDLLITTPLLDLNFKRAWRSDRSSENIAFAGWRHSYDWRVRSLSLSYTSDTNTYLGTSGHYVALDAPVVRSEGRFGGGTYYFLKVYTNPNLEGVDDPVNGDQIIRESYFSVGRSMSGVRLDCMGDWSWRLSGFSGSGISYGFNVGGRLVQIEHPAGATVSLNYDDSNRLTNVVHSCGTALNLTYAGAYLIRVENNRDTNLWVTYSQTNYGSGDYSRVFHAIRHISNNSADDLDFGYYYKQMQASTNANDTTKVIVKKVTPVGDIYLWQYLDDYSLRANGAWIVSGGITNNYGTTFDYQSISAVASETEVVHDRVGGGATATYGFDLVKGVATYIEGPLTGQTETRSYDSVNNLTNVHYVQGDDNVYVGTTYNSQRNPVGVYLGYGGDYGYKVATLSWTTNRLLSAIRDPFGAGYSFGYTNTLPNVVSARGTNNASRTLVRLGYNGEGLVSAITNANAHVTTINRWTNASGTEMRVAVYPASGYGVRFDYDLLGRPKKILEYGTNGTLINTHIVSDYAGRPLWVTNALNQVSSFEYDKAGRLICAEDAGGRYVTNKWRLGKLVSSTVGKTGSSQQARISLNYDPQMTALEVRDPRNRPVEKYALDAAGQITSVTNLDGQTMSITRGALGKVNEVERFDGSTVSLSYESIYGQVGAVYYPYNPHYYSYLDNGLLTGVSDQSGEIGLDYDQWNRCTNLFGMVDGWLSYTNSFAYDNVGNLTAKSLVLSDLYSWTNAILSSIYTYDDNERLVGEYDANNAPLWLYSYNVYTGALSRATNAVTSFCTDYSYDALGRLTRLTCVKPNIRSAILNDIYYTYDASGMISSKDIDGGALCGWPSSYTYDALGQLISEDNLSLSTNSYTYDLAGNRTSATINGTTYLYNTPNNNNRLASWGSNGSMSYDSAGNVIVLNRNTKTNIFELNWDSEYRLTSAFVGTEYDYESVTYNYDVMGRIYSRFDNNSGMYYIYDGLNLVADYDYYEDRIVRTYTYGPGVDNIQSMTVYDANGDSETYYYMKDISNTVLSLMGADGIVVEFYRYDAFGNVTIYDNPTWAIIPESAYGNRFLFQGREYDYKTQLYNFRARWYDPETGRWLSNDPIGISVGLNLYAFCANNPVCFVDPSGTDVFFCREILPGGHAWVKIGGKKYCTDGDSGTSYGGYPSGLIWGNPILVQSPDDHENDSDFWTLWRQYKTTPRIEQELINTINNKYCVESPNEAPSCERKRNPNYNFPFFTCRDFSDDVEDMLIRILTPPPINPPPMPELDRFFSEPWF